MIRGERIAIALGLGLAVWYVLVAIDSAGVADMGDGVQHHLIARWAQLHPHLLLDHWGKPLFTLLALPFAQFGLDAMAVFNAVLAALTCWVALLALRGAGGYAQLSFPLLVMLGPLYRHEVVAGMTEILFGAMTVVVLWLLLRERWVLAAVVASFTPLSRPEFIVFVPVVASWLCVRRRWKALPFLATGLAIYSLIAWIALDDALWYWNRDPYPVRAVYGSGDPWHFVDAMHAITGRPLMVLFAAAFLLWPLVWRSDREHRRVHLLLLIVAAGSALLILGLHSFLWARGLKGSAGLTRVVVTGVPLAGIFTAFTLARAATVWLKERTLRADLGALLFAGVACWSWADLQLNRIFPIRPNVDQEVLDAAGEMVHRYASQGRKVHSTHPYMGVKSGVDPFDPDRYITLWGTDGFDHRFNEGDLIFWESQFGPNENGIPLDALLGDPKFNVLGFWAPRDGHAVLGGHRYELFLFERRDSRIAAVVDTLLSDRGPSAEVWARADTLACQDGERHWCFGEGEFPVEIVIPSAGPDVLFDDFEVTGSIRLSGEGQEVNIVYGQKLGDPHIRYEAKRLKNGSFVFHARAVPLDPEVKQLIYLYNVDKRPFRVDGFTAVRKRWAGSSIGPR